MYCKNCGKEIDNNAYVCIHCGVLIDEPKPRFYKAGFVLGILSLSIPFHGLILGIIGLPMAIISKRKSSIIMNIIGIVAWISALILMFSFLFHSFMLNKPAITSEDFSAKATSSGFTVVDVSEQHNGQTVISLLAVEGNESFQIEFYIFEENLQARNAFSQHKAKIDINPSGSYVSSNGNNWAKYAKTSGGTYSFVSYIDNTLVYARVPQEHKQATQDFIKELGY